MSEQSVEWHITQGKQVPYEQALTVMEARVDAIIAGKAPELIWLLEHPPLYTAGTSAKAQDLINPQFPVYTTGRGGQYTYHGPGQRVVYVMLNLRRCMQGKPDLRRFVWMLEEWVIQTLAEFDVHGQRREGRVGIWVNSLLNGATASNATPDLREEKIAAIGIRLRQWVSFHGIAINVNPDLSHYAGIVPCGIREHGVTSMHALGRQVTLDALDIALKRHFPWD